MPDSLTPNDTYVSNGFAYEIEEGGITTTVYFDATFDIIGEAIEDPANNVSFSEVITYDTVNNTYTVEVLTTRRVRIKHIHLRIVHSMTVSFQAKRLLTVLSILIIRMALLLRRGIQII